MMLFLWVLVIVFAVGTCGFMGAVAHAFLTGDTAFFDSLKSEFK